MSIAPAQAQVTYDMSKVTCAQYLAMDAGTSQDFSAWMSGWFNEKAGSTAINVEGYRTNVASVRNWCASNSSASVMESLKTSVAAAKPGIGGPTTIRVSQISCGAFLEVDPDTRALISSWTGGWFMSTKNLTNVDLRYVKRNMNVIEKYCRSHKNESLMSALHKNWR
jgi:hypothetical protein